MCVHTYVCVHVCVRSNGMFLSASCSLALPPGRLPSWFKVSLFLSGVRVQTSCWEQFPKLLFLFEFPPFYFKKPFSFPKTKGPVERVPEGKPHLYMFGGSEDGAAACIAQNTNCFGEACGWRKVATRASSGLLLAPRLPT